MFLFALLLAPKHDLSRLTVLRRTYSCLGVFSLFEIQTLILNLQGAGVASQLHGPASSDPPRPPVLPGWHTTHTLEIQSHPALCHSS
jgi:hypothetical protein